MCSSSSSSTPAAPSLEAWSRFKCTNGSCRFVSLRPSDLHEHSTTCTGVHTSCPISGCGSNAKDVRTHLLKIHKLPNLRIAELVSYESDQDQNLCYIPTCPLRGLRFDSSMMLYCHLKDTHQWSEAEAEAMSDLTKFLVFFVAPVRIRNIV